MSDFGVVPSGFNRKLLVDILADLTTAQRATFGALLDTAAATELGQMNGTFASALAEVWELVEAAYHAFDPDAAADYALTALAALTGTDRRAAVASKVTLTLNINAGSSVPAGSIVQHSSRADIRFTLDATTTNGTGSAADFPVAATCTQTGPINAIAGSLTVIITPASGWNSVTNAADVSPGRVVDSDIVLRQRREDELALRGGSTVRAIRADLLDFANHPELAGINQVSVLENATDGIDANGLLPHSFEVVLDDGDVPSVANNDIAQAIFDSKPAGIQTNGSTSGTATDENGDTHTIYFSRYALRPVYLSYTLSRGPDYPADGDTQVKTAVVSRGQLLRGGDSVIALIFETVPFTIAGVRDVTAFALGFAPSPTLALNLTLGVRERATFSSVNIAVA